MKYREDIKVIEYYAESCVDEFVVLVADAVVDSNYYNAVGNVWAQSKMGNKGRDEYGF